MENPFIKLAMEGEEAFDDKSSLTPSAEIMTPDEKRQRLAQLREWLGGAQTAEEADEIKEEIKRLEQK
ncbi:MAG: hypothetical protein A3B86_04190 [Candidatus Yanofskybacteria bacterium RIFCSPHIGHO2_02_FULL_38_22b]|uniref:Uncharacterized protein n=1 Tax=Candidatus Yanofskybacteria bacterium RIFCSPHIGHO2_02_FULL_38_22b TaxID=1802673 RepID=A0A1F8F132_9BACT|nr:MAG: hypothetical protein A2816_01960 [Candidatus Yanofskybacteria bacterium RIFCSPHIGHO2_01_FULL_39_44]OGN06290.1 MAG: hypothetical protein A3B86_04190 [Candidatus Yanofskybacteria bacterium RIFCSPHIGHO2_02_FULL_38_22b]OGN19710.1 MAG: hypothetical protein A2910_03925 [Candidatus Yanofskybacteria bacterium RIFCSPLOWO2_01_FULL_39_28]